MDIYKRKSHWKKYLAAVGVVLILISQFYAQYLSKRLAEEEMQKADLWAKAYAELNNPVNEACSSCQDLTIPFDIIKNNQTIPVILVDPSGQILARTAGLIYRIIQFCIRFSPKICFLHFFFCQSLA